mgnify:CR=1 FL=1
MTVVELSLQTPIGCIYVKKWVPPSLLSKVPVILLHDSLGSCALWKDFPQTLAKILLRPVIAYDRLGFGKSDARQVLPSNQFIEEEAISYFPQIKSALGVTHYILLGHSVGGAMAINIAALDNQCDAVITIAAQSFVEEITLRGIQVAKEAFKDQKQMERLTKWHGEKAQWVLKAWTDIWLSSSFRHWQLNNIKQVYCPLLAIHGKNDEYGSKAFPEYIVNNSKGISRMEIIDDCGHTPHKSHSEHTLMLIKNFITEQ